VVEWTFAWATRFRRLVRDYERLPQTLADLHVIALVCIMLRQAVNYIALHNRLWSTVPVTLGYRSQALST
jgi:hypothetical protein